MTADANNRFQIISQLVIQSASGANVVATAETALKLAAEYVGLEAITLLLWNENGEPSLSVSHAVSEQQKKRLSQIESDLFAALRKKHQLASAYMSFGGEHPYHSFTLPLQFQGVIRGAVIGIQEGERRTVSENLLLEALAALLALVQAAEKVGQSTDVSGKQLEDARLAAIVETAVTINHEVNNPLTAVLGNVQLLLLKRDDLDNELVAKLKVIEESAMKIKDITQKLLRIKKVRSKEYTEGTRMLDLSDDEDS